MPRRSARLSSQVTRSASRPLRAAQKPRPTTATPDGTRTTWVTPFTRRAAAASTDFTMAPNRGGRAMTAVSMPGNAKSAVNCAEPSVLALPSTRGGRLPISLKSFGSFNVTWAGGVSAAAFAASSPKVARRPDGACDSTLASDGDLRGGHAPLARGRLDEHGPRSRAGAAHLLPRLGHRGAAARELRAADQAVAVARGVGGRRLDPHLAQSASSSSASIVAMPL